jgi:hypothetical protein
MQTPKHDRNWQTAMRPLMSAILVGLTLFFFAATLLQVVRLNERIDASPKLDAAALTALAACGPGRSEAACSTERRLQLAVALEVHTIALRHHEAAVLLMAALWSRYVGFVTGMTLALVGAAFILGRLTDGGTQVTVGGDSAAVKLALATASPGIVMVIAGVVLMTLTITTLQQFSTHDAAIYFSGDAASPAGPPPSIYMEPGAAAAPASVPLPGLSKGSLK